MILGIYGSGGCGRDARDAADLSGNWTEIVFIDDTVEEGLFMGLKRMPFELFCQSYDRKDAEVVIAMGEPEYKISLHNRVKREGYPFGNIIHPTALISPFAKLGEGIIIKAGAIVSCNVTIEDNVGIEIFAVVGHDCIVRESCQISPGVIIGGVVR